MWGGVAGEGRHGKGARAGRRAAWRRGHRRGGPVCQRPQSQGYSGSHAGCQRRGLQGEERVWLQSLAGLKDGGATPCSCQRPGSRGQRSHMQTKGVRGGSGHCWWPCDWSPGQSQGACGSFPGGPPPLWCCPAPRPLPWAPHTLPAGRRGASRAPGAHANSFYSRPRHAADSA